MCGSRKGGKVERLGMTHIQKVVKYISLACFVKYEINLEIIMALGLQITRERCVIKKCPKAKTKSPQLHRLTLTV